MSSRLRNPSCPRRSRPTRGPRAHQALILVAGLSLGACTLSGSGTETLDSRELDTISAIDIGGAFELTVHVAPGTTQRVEVRGDDNIVPKVLTKVSRGELDVSLDHWMVRPSEPIQLELWLDSLTKLDASGASNIRIEGLHGERFELELSGASGCKLSGVVDEFELDSSGASNLDARDLDTREVEVDMSGAGDAVVRATERLDAEVSGAGSVTYFGDPAEVRDDVSGAGKIIRG